MNIKIKLLKALHILNYSLKGKSQLDSIQKIDNQTLNIVVDTMLWVQANDFSEEDKQVFQSLDKFRNELSQSNEIIDYKIFGSDETGIVHDIFRRAASPEIWCKYLYLLAKNLDVKNYLEIGTNLGVSGSYILSALKTHPDCHFVTMEGVPKLCAIAEKQFQKIGSNDQFRIFQGLYQDTFPKVIDLPFDFEICFIDGNHKLEPTLQYFNQLKEKTTESSVFIFDDIYWSDEMIESWKIIKKDPSINFAIDLFKMGIVIIDKHEKRKKIIFSYYLDKIL